MQKPAVFLDRDGVLNRAIVRDGKPYAPRVFEDFHILPEAIEVTYNFKKVGFLIIVVTNQPDVGNGFVEKSVVDSMNKRLTEILVLDGIKVCYHTQDIGCACRKPKPGMLLEASREFDIDLSKSFMIGDRSVDILAGLSAGCQTIFIDYGYKETQMQKGNANYIVDSLQEAGQIILQQSM